MKMLTASVLLLLASCDAPPLSNDAVISETRKCELAGLRAQAFVRLDYQVFRVQCVPAAPVQEASK